MRAALEKDPNKREVFAGILKWAERMATGLPFAGDSTRSADYVVDNLFISQCFNCDGLSIWLHDRLLFPSKKSGAEPNPDLPAEIIEDYEEARTILDLSPRGAAALLRLVVQKLCAYLGEKGKDIDADIASLIAKGLDPMIGEALDSVRVIGNQAVHPGQMDLKDDRDTAAELFDVVNAIADHAISRPKKLKAIFDKLPQAKKDAINARNAKALGVKP